MSVLEIGEERGWDILAVGSAALAGIGARQLMQGGWKLVRGDEPPENPASRSVSWGEAVAWTVATGVVVGIMRLLAERGAASGWKRVKGHYPKGLE